MVIVSREEVKQATEDATEDATGDATEDVVMEEVKRATEEGLENHLVEAEQLEAMEKEALNEVKASKREAWTSFTKEIKAELAEAVAKLTRPDADERMTQLNHETESHD